MVKLYRKGFNISLIKAIIDLYDNIKAIIDLYVNMYSCVRSQGVILGWFPLKRGTRQGGCLSPFLYLVFGNDLLDELKSAYESQCGFPSYADDLLLLTLLKRGMNALLILLRNGAYMSRDVRKPVFGVSDQVRHKSGCAIT